MTNSEYGDAGSETSTASRGYAVIDGIRLEVVDVRLRAGCFVIELWVPAKVNFPKTARGVTAVFGEDGVGNWQCDSEEVLHACTSQTQFPCLVELRVRMRKMTAEP